MINGFLRRFVPVVPFVSYDLKRMQVARFPVALLGLLTVAFAQTPPAAPPAAPATPAVEKEKSIDDLTKDYERIPGILTVYRQKKAT